MARLMYDAVTPGNIPASAQMVAGYVDGRYAWSAGDWARFPNAVKVRIAVFPWTNDGHVLDVEPGDATPAQAVGWVQRRRAAGVDPTVYCGLATTGYSWAQVRAAFQAAGVAEPHYWVAAYPGNGAQLYPGSVAHQYANPGPYDLSVVADYWPGVDSVSTTSNVTSTTGGAIPGAPGTLTATPPEDDMSWDQLIPNGDTNPDGSAIMQPAWTVVRDARIIAGQAKAAAEAVPADVWGTPIQNGDQGVPDQPAWTLLRDARILAGYAFNTALKQAANGQPIDTASLLAAIKALPEETVAAIKAAL